MTARYPCRAVSCDEPATSTGDEAAKPPALHSWSPAAGPARVGRLGEEFRLDLRMGCDRLELRLGGKLSIDSARPLAVVLASLNRLTPPVLVLAGQVSAIDADGLRPLFEIARYRHERALAPLKVDEFSDAIRELLTRMQIPCTQRLDFDAWDQAESRTRASGDRRRGHLRLTANPTGEPPRSDEPSEVGD